MSDTARQRWILAGVLAVCAAACACAAPRPNILFIAIDDMNDWTGFLGGHPQAITPNMDRLAAKGVNFTNAHCPAPGCSPSRNALLYGVEPFHSGLYPFYEQGVHEELHQRYTSLPRFLRENGYVTYGTGKIHHGSHSDPREWTEYHKVNDLKKVFAEGRGYQVGTSAKMSFRPTLNPLAEHPDHQRASFGIEVLSRTHDQPFFLAVGFVKPHLPFDAPARFFDALPETILPPAIREDDLNDVGPEARSMCRLRDDKQFRKDDAWEDVRRAYLACNAWTDFNVGRVLDALEHSRYAEDTVIVLWSDHGYHLGEKHSFRKFTLWEEATRVPFLIHDPRDPGTAPARICSQPVSLISIYRTLAELVGLQPPDYVDGISLVPQLRDPAMSVAAPAITSWGRGNYAVRTEHWRYIRYFDGDEELYAHEEDPNEWRSLADHPEYREQKARLAGLLPRAEAPLFRPDLVSPWSVYGADKANINKPSP